MTDRDFEERQKAVTRTGRFPESVRITGARQEISRMESAMRARILAVLAGGAMTVPEIAEALGTEKDETLRWVMGCWRYGYLAPEGGEDDDGYYRYALVEKE
ncbi:MAG TPA: hypothetical protein VLA34_03385 [Candidatus Krumholzibacterium sp.]|nr:hypothetical protein [Candidatus Krumholzibacterium sp.]